MIWQVFILNTQAIKDHEVMVILQIRKDMFEGWYEKTGWVYMDFVKYMKKALKNANKELLKRCSSKALI